MSLSEVISEKRFTELSDLLTQLPQASRFWSAMVNDPDYASMVLEDYLSGDEDDEETPKWSPEYRDYSAQYQILAQIYNMLGVINHTTAAAAGGKPRKPQPLPGPKTGIDRAKAKIAREQANNLYAAFGRATPDWDVKVTKAVE